MRQFTTNEKKYWRIVTAIVSLFFIIVAFWTIIDALSPEVSVGSKNTKYRISTSVNHGYILKSGEVSSSKSELLNRIAKIQLNFDYDISMSDYFNAEASYFIKAEVKEKDDNDYKIVAEETLKLVNQPITNDGVSNFNIKDKMIIDYVHFNNMAKSNKEYVLTVSMFVKNKLDILSSNDSTLENSMISIDIPLAKEKIEVEGARQFSDKTLSTNLYIEKPANYLLVIMSVLTIVFVLPLAIASFKEVYRLTSYGYYEKKLGYIKKKYSKKIVEMDKRPTFNPTLTIDVKGIDELAEISKELSLPIQSYTDDEKSQIIYSVVGLKMTYRYILHI